MELAVEGSIDFSRQDLNDCILRWQDPVTYVKENVDVECVPMLNSLWTASQGSATLQQDYFTLQNNY